MINLLTSGSDKSYQIKFSWSMGWGQTDFEAVVDMMFIFILVGVLNNTETPVGRHNWRVITDVFD